MLPSPALFAVGEPGLLRALLAFSAAFFWTFLALLAQLAQEARFGRWVYGPPVLIGLLHNQEEMAKSGAPRAPRERRQTMSATAPWSLAQYFLSDCHGLNTAVGTQGMARGEAVGICAMFQQERQT